MSVLAYEVFKHFLHPFEHLRDNNVFDTVKLLIDKVDVLQSPEIAIFIILVIVHIERTTITILKVLTPIDIVFIQ